MRAVECPHRQIKLIRTSIKPAVLITKTESRSLAPAVVVVERDGASMTQRRRNQMEERGQIFYPERCKSFNVHGTISLWSDALLTPSSLTDDK